MIAAWMIYTLGVSLLLYAGARTADVVARAFRLPTRWIWLGAMMASVVVSTVALIGGLEAPPRPAMHSTALGIRKLGPIVITILPASAPTRAPRASLALTIRNTLIDARATIERAGAAPSALDVAALNRWNAPLLGAWSAVSSIVIVLLGAAAFRLRKLEHSFLRRVIGGEKVFVSDDVGPAVFGVFTPRIVVPAWVFELSHASRAKIYEHERAHVDAYDPAVLCIGMLIVALQPWNAALWLMLLGLRPAIELDCDRRVIGSDARSVSEYARLILSVYERCAVTRSPYMAFAARPSNLEQRLRMLTHRRRRSPALVLTCAVATIGLMAMAWTFGVPDLHAAQRASRSATAPRAGVSNGLQLARSARATPHSMNASTASTPLTSCHVVWPDLGPWPDCTIDGPAILYAIDSSHILVAFRNADDATGGDPAPYMIYGSRSMTVPQIRWRNIGHAEIRDQVLVFKTATSADPFIVIGSTDAKLRARYPNARVFAASETITYFRDPGIDWNALWELPFSLRCPNTYPLSPPSEAEFHDSTHAATTPGYACVVKQPRSLRVVKY